MSTRGALPLPAPARTRASWRTGRPGTRELVAAVPVVFRWLVVACLAVTYRYTWPLWGVHDAPPMLPVPGIGEALPAVALGWPLTLSLGVILVAPRWGMILHTLLLGYAIAIDQTRLQPEFVSLLVLLWGTLPNPSARVLARAHLVSLWGFAGVNKLFSPAFLDGTAQWMVDGLWADAPDWLRDRAGYLIGGTELGLGLLALFPRTRKLAALGAIGLHLGILLDLSPLGHDWNRAVWPWNLTLAGAGVVFLWPWRGAPWRCLGECPLLARWPIALLLVAPAGFYVGLTDAYLAHNLYSSNTAEAVVSCAGPCRPGQQPNDTWAAFDVPLPPEHRLFEQSFAATCRPGDELLIFDSRWWFRRQGRDERRLACPADAR